MRNQGEKLGRVVSATCLTCGEPLNKCACEDAPQDTPQPHDGGSVYRMAHPIGHALGRLLFGYHGEQQCDCGSHEEHMAKHGK